MEEKVGAELLCEFGELTNRSHYSSLPETLMNRFASYDEAYWHERI